MEASKYDCCSRDQLVSEPRALWRIHDCSCIQSAQTYSSDSNVVYDLHFKDPWGAERPNSDHTSTSWRAGGSRPIAGVQLWAKPLGDGQTAALFINCGRTARSTDVELRELNITSTKDVTVMDVWSGFDAGPVVDGKWNTGVVDSLSSRFVIFAVVT